MGGGWAAGEEEPQELRLGRQMESDLRQPLCFLRKHGEPLDDFMRGWVHRDPICISGSSSSGN